MQWLFWDHLGQKLTCNNEDYIHCILGHTYPWFIHFVFNKALRKKGTRRKAKLFLHLNIFFITYMYYLFEVCIFLPSQHFVHSLQSAVCTDHKQNYKHNLQVKFPTSSSLISNASSLVMFLTFPFPRLKLTTWNKEPWLLIESSLDTRVYWWCW